MKLLLICLICLLPPATARAGSSAITLVQSWSGSLNIPDNSDIGASNTIILSAPGLTRVESVTLSLEIDGGWNGDLYAYLVHDGGLTVLMNRPGRTLANASGFGSSGMSVTFSDLAAADIHTTLPDSGVPTGYFQPDGRTTDPLAVLDTDSRSALLSAFVDRDPNGSWVLFLADQSPGDTATLKSWSLSVTAVPEPSAAMLGALAVPLVLRRRRGARA